VVRVDVDVVRMVEVVDVVRLVVEVVREVVEVVDEIWVLLVVTPPVFLRMKISPLASLDT
jgi:hypothetical protein